MSPAHLSGNMSNLFDIDERSSQMPEPNRKLDVKPVSPPKLNTSFLSKSDPSTVSPTVDAFYSPQSSPSLVQRPQRGPSKSPIPVLASAAEAQFLPKDSPNIFSSKYHQSSAMQAIAFTKSDSICDESFVLGPDDSMLELSDDDLNPPQDVQSPAIPASGLKESTSMETFKDALSTFSVEPIDVSSAEVIQTSVPPPPESPQYSNQNKAGFFSGVSSEIFTTRVQPTLPMPANDSKTVTPRQPKRQDSKTGFSEFDPLATVNRNGSTNLLGFDTPAVPKAAEKTAPTLGISEVNVPGVSAFAGASLLDVQNFFATPKTAMKYSEKDMEVLKAELTAKVGKLICVVRCIFWL
jgi:hypothetical protein